MTRNYLSERHLSQYFGDHRGESRTTVTPDDVVAVLDNMTDSDRAETIERAAEVTSTEVFSAELGCTDAMALALCQYALAGGR